MSLRFSFSPLRMIDLRTAADMSRDELAEATNLSYWCFKSWETGRSVPKAESLAAVAAVLGCSMSDFFIEVV